MRVVLFRHGIAGSRDARRWPDDALRPLTTRGRERTEQAARGLRKLIPLTRILSSPLLRATQTADVLKATYEMTREIELLPALAPGGSFHEVIQRLRALRPAESVALIGHEPDLGKLAAVLAFGAPASSIPLKKAGACILDFVGKPESGHGKLAALLPPRMLRRRGPTKARPKS